MKLTNEFQPIRDWRTSRGLNTDGNVGKQIEKLEEELQELKDALASDNQEEVEDAIGDMTVVLTGIAELRKCKIENCVNSAYNVISKRTGRMISGTFVKDSDIHYIEIQESSNGKRGPYGLTNGVNPDNLYVIFKVEGRDDIVIEMANFLRYIWQLFEKGKYGGKYIIFLKDLKVYL